MPKCVDAEGVGAYDHCDRINKDSHTVIIMPRGFSEREKDAIRTSLLNAGRTMLSTHGVYKTSVQDLTRAAHISKGAFYQFFPSKEALFLALFEEAELAYRQQLCELARRPGPTAKARTVAFLHDTRGELGSTDSDRGQCGERRSNHRQSNTIANSGDVQVYLPLQPIHPSSR